MARKNKNKNKKNKKNLKKNKVTQPVSLRQIPSIIGADFQEYGNDINELQKKIDSLPPSKEKRRILFSTEASFLHTGFSTYLRELFLRLNSTNKYELAEMGSYSHAPELDPRARQVPWKFYHVLPSNPVEEREYKKDYRENQFGKWKLPYVLLDFKPDIILLNRDHWMDNYVLKSPLRENCLVYWMPTVDGFPQKWQWIKDYGMLDGLFTYSWFGKKVLEEQSRCALARRYGMKPLNVLDVIQPGVDLNKFKPIPRNEVLKAFNIPDPSFGFVGTVMRNQPRKLFPRIVESFRMFKEQYPCESNKVFLLLHTSYPDVGWDIPEFIRQNGLEDCVVWSYRCRACGNIAISSWRGSPTDCPICKTKESFTTPNTQFGYDDEQFNLIYNIMDVYIQGTIAEGCFGKGTLVHTQNGHIPIENVQPGDKILSHNGKWQTVNKTFINPVESKVLKLNIAGTFEDIILTENHNMFIAELTEEKDNWGRKKLIPNGKIIKTEAGKLSKSDWLACPIDRNIIDVDYLKITDYVEGTFERENGTVGYKTNRYNKNGIYTDVKNKFELNQDNLKLIGLLLGDGHFDGKYVSISGHKVKKAENFELFAKKIRNLTENQVRLRNKTDTDASKMSVSSPVLSKFFSALLGKYSRNRKIPFEFMHLPVEKQKSLIQGYYLSDNTTDPTLIGFSTSSLQLAVQLRSILSRMNILMYVSRCKRAENEYKTYTKINRVELAELVNELNFSYERPQELKIQSKIINNHIFTKVKNIEETNYNENVVYNLQAINENNIDATESSFAVSCATAGVGNCGMPINEAKSAGTPCLVSDYSACYEKARNGGALPIKNICDDPNLASYTEQETGQNRSLFDRQDLANKLALLMGSETKRSMLAKEARECAVKYYDWNLTAKKWEYWIDSANIKKRDETWKAPVELKPLPNYKISDKNLSNKEFIEECYLKIISGKRPDPGGFQTWMQNLQRAGPKGTPQNKACREQMEAHFRALIEKENEQKQLKSNINNTITDPVERINKQVEEYERQ